MRTELSNPKWHDVLLAIYKCGERGACSERLNRQTSTSMTHIRAIVQKLCSQRLINIVPGKRAKQLELTDKGQRVAAFLINIRAELGLVR